MTMSHTAFKEKSVGLNCCLALSSVALPVMLQLIFKFLISEVFQYTPILASPQRSLSSCQTFPEREQTIFYVAF